MISVEEACRLVMEKRKGYSYIGGITDTGDLFTMGLLNDEGQAGTGNGVVIDKSTKEISAFVWTKEMLLKEKNGKPVEIPEKYRYPGEIKY